MSRILGISVSRILRIFCVEDPQDFLCRESSGFSVSRILRILCIEDPQWIFVRTVLLVWQSYTSWEDSQWWGAFEPKTWCIYYVDEQVKKRTERHISIMIKFYFLAQMKMTLSWKWCPGTFQTLNVKAIRSFALKWLWLARSPPPPQNYNPLHLMSWVTNNSRSAPRTVPTRTKTAQHGGPGLSVLIAGHAPRVFHRDFGSSAYSSERRGISMPPFLDEGWEGTYSGKSPRAASVSRAGRLSKGHDRARGVFREFWNHTWGISASLQGLLFDQSHIHARWYIQAIANQYLEINRHCYLKSSNIHRQ